MRRGGDEDVEMLLTPVVFKIQPHHDDEDDDDGDVVGDDDAGGAESRQDETPISSRNLGPSVMDVSG